MGDDNVVELRQWHTVDELAEREGVSVRTIYRRLERGEIEKRETPEGTRYRKATDSTDSHDTDTDSGNVSSSEDRATDTTGSTDSGSVSNVSELADLLRENTDRIAELERQVGRLQAENERLQDELESARAGGASEDSEAGSDSAGGSESGTGESSGTSRGAELVNALRETAETTD